MKKYLPKRYRTTIEKYEGRLKLLAVIVLLYFLIDITLGTLILKYLDPIGFSQEHPNIVLFGFVVIFLIVRIFAKSKKPQKEG